MAVSSRDIPLSPEGNHSTETRCLWACCIRLPAELVGLHPRPCGGVCSGRPSRDDVATREERTIPDVLRNVQIC